MERGEVYLTTINLPDRAAGHGTVPTPKYVIVLRGGAGSRTEQEVPIVIASTNRRTLGPMRRPFEVDVCTMDGFQHDTIIDCRWPYTIPKSLLSNPTCQLSDARMKEVSVALVSGLQMYP
jgi:mRNA-degrading endonuclease toxin of MazEF toxin-antitoxin module